MKAPKPRNKQPDFVRKAGPHRDRTAYVRKNWRDVLIDGTELPLECEWCSGYKPDGTVCAEYTDSFNCERRT